MTRRDFLRTTGLAAAGSFIAPALLGHPFARRALADAIGDRYLVVFFLDGGNDGLNTVTPIANGTFATLREAYESVRFTGSGGVQLPDTSLLPLANDPLSDTPLGLHPALAGFKSIWDKGRLAVIQGCGYPEQNLSHEESRGFWETGDRFGAFPGNPGGWMGRYLSLVAGYGGLDIPAVNVRSSVAGEFEQTSTNVLAFTRLSNSGFPYDTTGAGGGSGDVPFKEEAFRAIYEAAQTTPELRKKFVGDAGLATLQASSVYPQVDDFYLQSREVWADAYPGTSTGRDLREIAKMIYAVENSFDPVVCARYFELRNGGYDTHADQGEPVAGGRHFDLHAEVGDAVAHFYGDLEDMGIAHKVCLVVWSEFSRRINQNSSGTDHGSQGPMFVLGGSVNGGIYGRHPGIGNLNQQGNTAYSQNPADPFRSTDFRDVFGTVLKHWLNVADPTVVFPPDDSGDPSKTDPNLYWLSADFDLGFLT